MKDLFLTKFKVRDFVELVQSVSHQFSFSDPTRMNRGRPIIAALISIDQEGVRIGICDNGRIVHDCCCCRTTSEK
jgi:hypothetical protein